MIVLVVIAVILAVIAALLLQNVARHRQGAAATSQAATSTTSAAAATTAAEPTPAPPVPDAQTLELIRSETHRDPADAQAKARSTPPSSWSSTPTSPAPTAPSSPRRSSPSSPTWWPRHLARRVARPRPDQPHLAPGRPSRPGRRQAGKFWEFHDAVYAAADPQGHPEYTEDSLVTFAKKAGVADIDRFRTDMNAAETVSAVTEAKEHAHSIGITGTPFMIVGETFISGYQDAEYMKAVINSQAAKAKTSDASKTSAAPTATR